MNDSKLVKKTHYREKNKVHYIPDTLINCNINKTMLFDIIKFTFSKNGKFNVFGYNTQENEFWAKKKLENNYLLHFTISINSYDYNYSNVTIKLVVGDDIEFKKIVTLIKNAIKIYQK